MSFPSCERVAKREAIGFVLPEGVSADILLHVMRRVIARLEPIIRLPETSLARVVTIQQKINDLFKRVKLKANITFRAFLSGARDRTEAVVSFLALLELVKQRFVLVEQGDLFHDINIKHNPDSSEAEPVTNDEFNYSTV
jgi:segregation and condensation protein A